MRLIAFILLSFVYSLTINVPSDQYPTIQSGIDVAQDGDTVLVAQGLYYENLQITRSITLASHAIYDDLTDWNFFNEIFWQWEVTNENINNTIIDGGTATDDFGSAILIYAEEETCITPEIIGFTIQNGVGTTVCRSEVNGEYQNCDENEPFLHVIGGGILFDISIPKVQYNKFTNNGSNDTNEGGSMYLTTIDEDWDYNQAPTNYFDLSNTAMRCDVEEFDLSNNYYNGNDALYGNSFANKGFEDTFNMAESIFDVANCNLEEVSPVWVYVEPEATLDLEEIESNLCAFSGPNAYVDSNIDQECIEDGCGTFNNPFKTITWAIQMIMPSEDNQVTLHLANGTYNPETGEEFPIILPSYVNLEGEDEELTILDATQTNHILDIISVVENNISYITITGGYSQYSCGIKINHSDPTLNYVQFKNNECHDWYNGGVLTVTYSNSILDNLFFTNNTVQYGNCIYMSHSDAMVSNIIIKDNSTGGFTIDYSNPIINQSIIYNNLANPFLIGGYSNPILINITSYGGGAGGQGIPVVSNTSHPIIINSIITSNQWDFGEALQEDQEITVLYSNIEGSFFIQGGLFEGEGNINLDPMFTDPENGAFTLQEGSPCIDVGIADIDGDGVDDITNYIGLAPDMGAFEYMPPISPGDLNQDQYINIFDIIILVEFALDGEYVSYGDVNQDGIIDVMDIVALVSLILDN